MVLDLVFVEFHGANRDLAIRRGRPAVFQETLGLVPNRIFGVGDSIAQLGGVLVE